MATQNKLLAEIERLKERLNELGELRIKYGERGEKSISLEHGFYDVKSRLDQFKKDIALFKEMLDKIDLTGNHQSIYLEIVKIREQLDEAQTK